MTLKIDIAPAFKILFDYERIKDYREFIFYGGRASGKTYHIRLAITLMCLREKCHFMIFREVEQQIKFARDDFKAFLESQNIPYTLQPLKESVEIGEYIVSVTNYQISFYNGSTITLSFINDKVSKKRKSLRHDLKGAWIDEANFITPTIRNDLLPSIRGDDSFIIYSFNPEDKEEAIYQTAIKPNLTTIYSRKVNYDENPFLPKAMETDRLNDLELLPREVYLHKWEGEPLEFNDNCVIDIQKIGYYDDSKPKTYDEIILTLDTAFSTKESADYSVIGVFARNDDKKIHLLRLYRGHWDFNTLIEMTKEAFEWAQSKGNVYAVLIEKKASGISLLQELKRLTNLPISELTPKTDKFARVCNVLTEFPSLQLPLQSVPLNDWVGIARKEMQLFRSDLKHSHDDIVDCIVYALEYFKNKGIDWNKLSSLISK